MKRSCLALLMHIGAVLSLYAFPARAGGIEGDIATLDMPTKVFLFEAFDLTNERGEITYRDVGRHEGITYRDAEVLGGLIQEYLRIHRAEYDISAEEYEPRQVDLVVCLLTRHGHSSHIIINPRAADFCDRHIRRN